MFPLSRTYQSPLVWQPELPFALLFDRQFLLQQVSVQPAKDPRQLIGHMPHQGHFAHFSGPLMCLLPGWMLNPSQKAQFWLLKGHLSWAKGDEIERLGEWMHWMEPDWLSHQDDLRQLAHLSSQTLCFRFVWQGQPIARRQSVDTWLRIMQGVDPHAKHVLEEQLFED